MSGLEPHTGSLNQGTSLYFTPISSVERKEKVDILELLHKANIDLKPLLSSLNVNKAHLKESSEWHPVFLEFLLEYCLMRGVLRLIFFYNVFNIIYRRQATDVKLPSIKKNI